MQAFKDLIIREYWSWKTDKGIRGKCGILCSSSPANSIQGWGWWGTAHSQLENKYYGIVGKAKTNRNMIKSINRYYCIKKT